MKYLIFLYVFFIFYNPILKAQDPQESEENFVNYDNQIYCVDNATNLVEELRRKLPIPKISHFFILKECCCQQFPISIREKFRSDVLNYILEKFPDKEAPLVLTSFSSGLLGMENGLLIALVTNKYKNIRLNVIDIEYDSYRESESACRNQIALVKWEEYITLLMKKNRGLQIRMRPFDSQESYNELVMNKFEPEVDLYIDVDSDSDANSPGNFNSEMAVKTLSERGAVKSLKSSWIDIPNRQTTNAGNILYTITKDGETNVRQFILIAGDKVQEIN